MGMTKAILKNIGGAALALMVAPSLVWAQATSSVFIPITNQIFEKLAGDDMARINLIREVQKANPSLRAVSNLEIQMLRLEVKSGVGGAQVFLRINNEMMDSRVVETDPDKLESAEPNSFEKMELKNIDRSPMTEASFVIQAFSNIRIRSLEVILGAVQEPVVFGHYADAQISQIGGAVTVSETEGSSESVRPNADTVNAIFSRYYAAPLQVIAPQPIITQQPQPQPQPVPAPVVQARVCVRHARGFDVCVGDFVKNTWNFSGKVVSVDVAARMIGVKFEFLGGDTTIRNVDTFKK